MMNSSANKSQFNIVKISNFNYSTVNENSINTGSGRRVPAAAKDTARRNPSTSNNAKQELFERRGTLTADPDEPLKLTIKKITSKGEQPFIIDLITTSKPQIKSTKLVNNPETASRKSLVANAHKEHKDVKSSLEA